VSGERGPGVLHLRGATPTLPPRPAAGDNYGDVTGKAMAMAIERVPRVEV
jgi:hypothetical protein